MKNQKRKILFTILAVVAMIFLTIVSFLPWKIVLGGVFILAGLVLLSFKIEYGLYAMIFFLPAISLNFNYKSLEVPMIDLISTVVFVSFLIKILIEVTKTRKINIRFPIFLFYFLFLVSALISSFYADYQFRSLWYTTRWIVLFYALYIFLPINIIKTKKILKTSLVVFFFSGIFYAILGILSLKDQNIYYELIRFKFVNIFGYFPFGENQNLLAEVMIPVIFFSIAMKNWIVENIRLKKVINIFIAIFILVLLGTFSRAGWFSLIAGFLVYVGYYHGKKMKKFIIPVIVIMFLILPLIFQMIKIQSNYKIGVSSTENRILLTKIALDAFQRKPFVGHGTGEYINIVADNIMFRARYGDPIDSHGVLQKVLTENGTLGMITFGFLIFGIFMQRFWQELKRKSHMAYLIVPMISGSVGIFIMELFNTSYYKGKFWLPIAMAIVTVDIFKNEE